ncbi:hypothetical protein IW262DRAFT_1298100 [Armillaria fumosa]|nr:hypothetical protein IW262DRAFT_1298100 [Armillaria fumosa]
MLQDNEIEQRQWQHNMEHVFLDLEAAVDNNKLEDHDSDNELAEPEEPEINGFNEMISGIEERWASDGTKNSEHNKDLSLVDYWLGTTINIHEFEKNDYLLWRVRCERFQEYEAMHHIMSNTDRCINICSVLYHNNLRGWIYMEAPYNETIKSFLLMTPGVQKMGVKAIKIAEWKTVLQEDDHIKDVFQIVILLIPWLSLEPPIKQLRDATNQELPLGQIITIFHGHKLLKGFLLKKMSSHGIEEATNIDVSAAGIFLTSDLPEVQTWTRDMPPPNGLLGSSSSMIESTQGRVKVWDASTSTTIETTYWDLHKEFSPGDFVVATMDAFKGHQGWVIEVHKSKLDIEVVILERNNNRNQTMVEFFTTHTNIIRRGVPSDKTHSFLQLNKRHEQGYDNQTCKVPWTEDVVLDPKIPSSLKVTVCYDVVYDSNRPYYTEGVPYEYVTECRSRWPLYSYCPLWPNKMMYCLQVEVLMHERQLFEGYLLPKTITNPIERERTPSPVHGCMPPFEGEHPPTSEIITMEDAAWNPRAKVDERLPKDHWIYNEVFKGKQLVVKADGVEKTIWVENDVLCIETENTGTLSSYTSGYQHLRYRHTFRVAVVMQSKGAPDVLTMEELDMEAKDMTKMAELKEDAKMNTSLKNSIIVTVQKNRHPLK